MLLWLWCRPAAAAPIQPLAWELPYATGAALKKKKSKKQKKQCSRMHISTYYLIVTVETSAFVGLLRFSVM